MRGTAIGHFVRPISEANCRQCRVEMGVFFIEPCKAVEISCFDFIRLFIYSVGIDSALAILFLHRQIMTLPWGHLDIYLHYICVKKPDPCW